MADGDGVADLGHGQQPAQEQVAQVDEAQNEDAAPGRRRLGEIRQIPVNAYLNELRPEQGRDGGQQGQD